MKLVLASFFTAVLVLVTVTDLEHRLIPNRAILPAIAIAALVSPLWFGPGWYLALVGGAIGYGFFWLAVQLGDRFIGRGAMGFGDVKLAAFVGLITGFPGIITALVRDHHRGRCDQSGAAVDAHRQSAQRHSLRAVHLRGRFPDDVVRAADHGALLLGSVRHAVRGHTLGQINAAHVV